MEDLAGWRWNCPNCKGEGTVSSVESKVRKPERPLLHCNACDVYFDWYGSCHSCGADLFLTDTDVDNALEGKQVPCAKCHKPLNTDRFNVGTTMFVGSAIPVPELAVRLKLPKESDFIREAKTRLAGDLSTERQLAVYHCSTAFRARAASRYLQALRNKKIPFSLALFNYNPETSNTTLSEDDSDFDLETTVFGFVMNARSTLDVLAHEINLVYRYTAALHEQAHFFDYTDPNKEKKVALLELTKKICSVCPQDPMSAFLNLETCAGWFKYLTDLRDVNYHRRILIGPRESRYSLKKLLRVRPTKVPPENTVMFLPDSPKLLWTNCGYNQKRELRTTFTEIEGRLSNFLDETYGYLTVRLR